MIFCPQCQHECKNERGLQFHVAKMHGDKKQTERLPYPCKKCDRTFVSEPAMKMHMIRVHGAKPKYPRSKRKAIQPIPTLVDAITALEIKRDALNEVIVTLYAMGGKT